MASRVQATDPPPEPPAKSLDPVQAARLAAEMAARAGPATPRAAKAAPASPPRRRARCRRPRPRKLVRTVVAGMATSEDFGWQVAAAIQRRGLGRAQRKGYIGDGQRYNWTLFEMHLVVWGCIGILDFLHPLAYLYGAAPAAAGKGSAAAWARYERWLRWAWAGRVEALRAGLRAACARLGPAPPGGADEDPRQVVAGALGYVENNRADGLPAVPPLGLAGQ